MKTNGFKPFDDVADSMAAAASRLGVPLEAVKLAKRYGSSAFRGSRVHLGRLTDDLEFVAKATGVSDVLLVVAEEVAQSVSYFLARCRRKRFVADHDKIYQAVHNGFAVALYVVEPDSADEFLKKSSAMFERVFEKSARNRRGQRVHQSKRNSSERS